MSTYVKSGNRFDVHRDGVLQLYQQLPANTYLVYFDEQSQQFYLRQGEEFKSPARLYGDAPVRTKRILTTFQDRIQAGKSLGVLLVGSKGSGKTEQARQLSIAAKSMGVPTILVNDAFHDNTFMDFIQSIDTPCVVIFDEFDKVYDESEQPRILTMLDGAMNSSKLFVMTCNDRTKIDQHMIDRPGRLHYFYEYRGVDESFIRSYCEHELNDKTAIEELVQAAQLMGGTFNFDSLRAVVEECNRFNERPKDVLAHINVRPHDSTENQYEITVLVNGAPTKGWHPSSFSGAPTLEERTITYYGRDDEEDDEDDGDAPVNASSVSTRSANRRAKEQRIRKVTGGRLKLSHDKLVSFDGKAGSFVYEPCPNVVVVCERQAVNFYDADKMFGLFKK